ncbi:hypothetical protein [Nostoc sp.]
MRVSFPGSVAIALKVAIAPSLIFHFTVMRPIMGAMLLMLPVTVASLEMALSLSRTM